VSERRVLFANHTGELAGAERSLLDLLEGFSGEVAATVACPRGELHDALRAREFRVAEIPGTSVSFRPHPIHTTRGLVDLGRTGMRLRRLAGRGDVALVHANTERAGLSAALARSLGGPPVVVHARGRFPDNRFGAATARVLARGASAIVANSRYTAEQFRAAANGKVEVVHNPIDCQRFDPAKVDRASERAKLRLDPDDPVLAVIGYLAPVKRQEDAIRILAGVKRGHPRARLLLVGAARFAAASARADHIAYESDLKALARELGVERDVVFLGERDDIRDVLGASDVLLVPSLQEGFGRVALEGMAMGMPVIATSVGGTTEIIRDGVDGLLLPPRNPERWADVALRLLSDPDRRRTLGVSARVRAIRDFSPEAHVAGVVATYERVLTSGHAEGR
jgi:glycosyltransferase involved in cell wall biosynthesis